MRNPPQAVKYPDPDDCTLKFQAFKKQILLPFYLVCDFESFLSPADDDDDDYHKATRLIDEHRVCGFACHRVTDIVQYQTDPVVYSGPDPMSVFCDHVMSESKIIGEILNKQKDMLPLSNEQQIKYDAATHCTACGTTFTAKNHKVRQHCHVNCNLQLKITGRKRKATIRQNSNDNKKPKLETDEDFFLPVVFHNLKSYDGHIVIKRFKKEYTERKKAGGKPPTYDDVIVTPLNSEKYVMFQVGKLRFLDSSIYVYVPRKFGVPSSKKWSRKIYKYDQISR